MRILTFFIALIFISAGCRKKNTEITPQDSASLLSANSWQLDRYTDTNNKAISNSNLNTAARLLFGLAFEFKVDNETRAFDKLTKTVLNRGTWALLENNSTIDINITGFKGKFKIVNLSKGKLTLETPTDSFLSGVGAAIRLEFTELK